MKTDTIPLLDRQQPTRRSLRVAWPAGWICFTAALFLFWVNACLGIVCFPAVLSAPKVLANGAFQFAFSAGSSCAYRVEASSNLVNWVTLTNIPAGSSFVVYTDFTATNAAQRFYRVAVVSQ